MQKKTGLLKTLWIQAPSVIFKYFSDCCGLRNISFLNVSPSWPVASRAFLITTLSSLPNWLRERRATTRCPPESHPVLGDSSGPSRSPEGWWEITGAAGWCGTAAHGRRGVSGSLSVSLLSCPCPWLQQVVQKLLLLCLAGSDTHYSLGSLTA